jgi:predicted nucleic acid-binding protein
MILLDTNVLVALVDERDELHRRAKRDLKALRRETLGVTSLILGEACFLLPDLYLRQRLQLLLLRLAVAEIEPSPPWWDRVFAWLERYADHDPDLADAQLAALSEEVSGCRVWTYDAEFRSIWRRPDGTEIPLAASLALKRPRSGRS